MPQYKTHLLGGFCSFIFALLLLSCIQPLKALFLFECMICSLAGSLFPDIDTKSKAQLWCYRIIFFAMIYLVLQSSYFALAIVSLLSMLPMIVHHRGIFHRLGFITLCLMIILFACYLMVPKQLLRSFYYIFFFWMGIISHLGLDFGFVRLLKFK